MIGLTTIQLWAHQALYLITKALVTDCNAELLLALNIITVSSAQKYISEEAELNRKTLLMKILNKKGPRIDPWETLIKIGW